MVLITGATGNVGRAVAEAARDAGHDVRAMSRDGSAEHLPDGVEAVAGDLDRPETVGRAADGTNAAFVLPGFRDMDGVMSELREHGVGHVVLLSGASAGDGDLDNAVSRYMILSERAVRASGLAWTILRPTAFMTNALRWRDQLQTGNVVRLPFPDVVSAMTDPRDIGAVASVALGDPAHGGQIYRLTGPQGLRPAEQVEIVGAALGRPLRFEAQPDDEARGEMSDTMPAAYVDAFFDFYVDGSLDESAVLPTVEEILGRPAGTLDAWARANVAQFA